MLRVARIDYEGERFQAVTLPNDAGTDPFQSPVIRLISSIYEIRPQLARKIVRTRIYVNYALELWERETIRVVAKRVTEDPQLGGPFIELLPLQTSVQVGSNQDLQIGPYIDRDVTAVLKGSVTGHILARSVNTNGKNRLMHAEVNLIQTVLAHSKNSEISMGDLQESLVLVSLQPCRMCAAWLNRWLRPLGVISVRYEKTDTGPLSKAFWIKDDWIRKQSEVEK